MDSISFDAESDTIATGDSNGTIWMWQREDGEVQSILREHTASIIGLGFVSADEKLVSASLDGTVRL